MWWSASRPHWKLSGAIGERVGLGGLDAGPSSKSVRTFSYQIECRDGRVIRPNKPATKSTCFVAAAAYCAPPTALGLFGRLLCAPSFKIGG